MVKVASSRSSESVSGLLLGVKDDAVPFRQVFDLLIAELSVREAVVISSLPRGGLQIVQLARLSESLTRTYAKELHAYDRLTWQAIAKGRPVRAREVWPKGQLETDRYYTDFMKANGLMCAAAAPLASPVLDGYPGAIHLYRTEEQGAFSDSDLRRLSEYAHELDVAIARVRASREESRKAKDVLPHQPAVRQFIFDAQLRPILAQVDPVVLDERLRENIIQDARWRIDHVNGHGADRVPLPDSRGDLWNFHVVTHRSYPALSQDGPVVFFCLVPACQEWSALRPADFQADPEVARLLPALKFMRDQFHRGPILNEIARTVHLSPFHFHRRFSDLLGMTPKHFLLDCQIQRAKAELLAQEKELVKIATDCGFAHQSHFTSRFKQATGLTPTRWRRMAVEAVGALRN
jgi:AraC-like DNA-binding protein